MNFSCKGKAKQKIIPVCLILLSVLLVGIGIAEGQSDSVLNKAINICLECIGIG